MKFILIVWLVVEGGPRPLQVTYPTAQACEVAGEVWEAKLRAPQTIHHICVPVTL